MLKLAIKDSLVYGVGGVATRAVGLLLLPLYSRILSPSAYGVFDLVVASATIAAIVVPLEVSLGLARLYPDADSAQNKRRYATTAWLFTLAMYGLFALLALGLYAGTRLPAVPDVSAPVLGLGLIYVVLFGLLAFLQNQLRWELKGLNYSTVTILNAFGGGALAAVLGWYFGLPGLLLGMVAGAAGAILLARLFVGRSLKGRWDASKLRSMLHYSLPLVPASLSALVTLYVDRALLTSYAGLHELGLFALGYRVASISLLGLIGIQGALIPLIYTHHAANRTPADIARLFRWFVGVSILLCGFLGLFAREILRVLVDSSFYQASTIVMVLAPACVMMQLYIFFPGMFLAKKTWLQLGVQAAAALANILVCLWLIPRLGFVGAALGNLAASVLFFGVWANFSQAHYRIPFEWRTLSHGVALYVIVVAIGEQLRLSAGQAVLVKSALFVALVLGLYGLRFVRTDEWSALLLRVRLRLGRAT